MMKISAFFLMVLILFSVRLSAQSDDHPAAKFDPARNPSEDLNSAVKEAQKSGKNILLDVGGEWCIWCHRIDAFIEGHQEINDFLHNNYIVMKVNYSQENKNEDFLSAYPKISGYPHFFVLDKNGKLLHSQNTGKLEQGKDYNPEKFMAFLRTWAPKE